MYYYIAKNKLYAEQGRAAANAMADSVRKCYERDSLISNYYNKIMANGKWNHMMDQTHIGYTYWQQPERNRMPGLKAIQVPEMPRMGVSIDEMVLPDNQIISLKPAFFQGEKQKHFIEIFNQGKDSFNYKITPGASYITVKPAQGKISIEDRFWIDIDWTKVPKGVSSIPLTIEGNNQRATAVLTLNKSLPANAYGFYEESGIVSIEAGHYYKAVGGKNITWAVIPEYGKTLSGVMPMPVTAMSQKPGSNSPHLEYPINLTDTGRVEVEAYISPTIDFTNTHGLRYAVSIDDEPPLATNINTDHSPKAWSADVSNNIKRPVSQHHITKPGRHILKYWMIDPGVVLQKIVINCGGEKSSYLGPPESYRR